MEKTATNTGVTHHSEDGHLSPLRSVEVRQCFNGVFFIRNGLNGKSSSQAASLTKHHFLSLMGKLRVRACGVQVPGP